MFTDRSRRAVTVGIVVLAVLGLIGMLMAPMASAHDRLTGSSPEDGERVEAPDELVLEFSGELSELGSAVAVTGPDGPATDGDPVPEGDTVRQPLAADLAPGRYEVAWRVTSGDGHPISGELSFEVVDGDGGPGQGQRDQDDTAGDTAGATAAPGSGATEAAGAGGADDGPATQPVEGEAAESAQAEGTAGTDEVAGTSDGFPWLWVVTGVAVGAVVVGAVAWTRRH